ncbi:MAG: penicillin-binding protein 2 [Prevotella sp.]|nr:penicillin-binding protein 2 [Prevotella sp.]
MNDYGLEYRKFVVAGVAIVIVVVYILRLFTLQLMSDDYKKTADSNAFLRKIDYPSRGVITDRNGNLLVYNQPSYDIMVVEQEARDHFDTLELCQTLGISRRELDSCIAVMHDTRKNPGYSRYTQQMLVSQLSDQDFSVFQEKSYRFPGFYVRRRSIRQYGYSFAAHVLGDVAEVSRADIEDDDYYQPGDYIGKLGVERFYEKVLRGEKGVQILLRDARGRVQGSYQNGALDHKPVPGRNLTLSIDKDLQELAERLLEGKRGSIVAIEPQTGEVLCMATSPSYDPNIMVGRQRSKSHRELQQDPARPLFNRSIMGTYPPGSTFKTTQGLTFLNEGVITDKTLYPCYRGFVHKGLRVGCHGHGSPLPLVPAISTSCNGYFCWGLYHMISDREKYPTQQDAINTWRDYLVSMGFGRPLGVDISGEKSGLIPNGQFYDKYRKNGWSALSIVSIAIGQGEVTATPLQIANLGATIANRGHFITPHVVRQIEGMPLDSLYTTPRRTMVRSEYYDFIARGMRSAALGGTCKALGHYDFQPCGKTGTAQNSGRDHSVFMGFAPMDSARIAVAVYVENGGWGATFGVPIGGLIMERHIKGQLSAASEHRASDIQHRHINYDTASK